MLSLCSLCLCGEPAAFAADSGWGPWQDEWADYEGVDAVTPPAAPRSGMFERAYRWYRGRVSTKDGARCPYYPTCSGYGITAVREWGPVVGGMYTVDRLLREYPGMDRVDHYPLVTPHETPRLYDPVPQRHRHRDDADRADGHGAGGAASR